MKIFKRVLVVLGILLALVVVIIAVALIPAVQKAIVLNLAEEPGTELTADTISAGFGGADLRNVHYTLPGAAVSLDSARVDTSLLGLIFGDTIEVRSVEAKNVVIDLTVPEGPPPPEVESTEPVAPDGFLGLASLPKALLVGKLALDGKLILPDANGPRTATFTVASGGIAPGTESVIEAVVLAPAESNASAAGETRLTVKLRQSSAGEITAASVHAIVKAQLPKQPPVELTATAELHKADGHEAWSVRVLPETARDPLLAANGTFDPVTQVFNGRAELAAAAAILAPWLPADLPALAATGEATLAFNLNTFDWDVRAAFDGTATGLAKLDARLAGLEPVKIQTEIAARSTGGAIQAEKYATTVFANQTQPLLDTRLLRPLALGADGLPDQASLQGGPLAVVALRGIPLSLARPFLPEGMTLSGGPVNAEFTVTADGDAFRLETAQPLSIPRLEAALPDLPLLAGSDVSARVRARLEPGADRATLETFDLTLAPADGVTAPTPSLQVALAQSVSFDLAAGALIAPGNADPLARIVLGSLPLALAQPFLPDGFALAGEPLTGELTVTAAGEAFVLNTSKPLTISGLRAGMDGSTLVQDQTLATTLRARLDTAANKLMAEAFQLTLSAAGQEAAALRVELGQPMTVDLDAGAAVLPQNDTPLAIAALNGFAVPDLRAFDPDLQLDPLPRVSGVLNVKALANDGWAVATSEPLTLTPTSITYAGEPLLANAGIATQLEAILAGDQVSITRGTVELTHDGGRALHAEFSGEANLETLAAPKFSVKASGDFARLARQPAVQAQFPATGGTFTFTADGSYTPAISAKGRLVLENVTAPTLGSERAGLSADFDANISADFLTIAGTTAAEWNVGSRASAIKASARANPQGDVSEFEATLAGEYVNADDVLAMLGMNTTSSEAGDDETEEPEAEISKDPHAAPFWRRYRGALRADIRRAVYQGNELSDIGTELTVTADAVTIKRAGLKLAGGPLDAKGSMRFVAAQKATPYALDASVTGKNIDTGALFKMILPDEPPMVAMQANLDAKLSGTAANLDLLVEGLNTDVHLVGTNGETRLFAAKSELVTTLGKLTSSGLPALIGLFDRKKKEEPATTEGGEPAKEKPGAMDYARMAGQLIQFFGSTPFDRCEIKASSEGMKQFAINQLTFSSPLVDIAARGSARIPEDGGWASLIYQLELTRFGASGEIGQLLAEVADTAPVKEGESFTYLAKAVPLSGNLSESNTVQLAAMLISKAQPFLQMLGVFR